MEREQQTPWRKQIFEVQTCRQVRGLAGGVMCENRDLGGYQVVTMTGWSTDTNGQQRTSVGC